MLFRKHQIRVGCLVMHAAHCQWGWRFQNFCGQTVHILEHSHSWEICLLPFIFLSCSSKKRLDPSLNPWNFSSAPGELWLSQFQLWTIGNDSIFLLGSPSLLLPGVLFPSYIWTLLGILFFPIAIDSFFQTIQNIETDVFNYAESPELDVWH